MAEMSIQGLLSTPKTLLQKGTLSTLGGMSSIQPVPEAAPRDTELGSGMWLESIFTLHANYVPPYINKWPHGVRGFIFL